MKKTAIALCLFLLLSVPLSLLGCRSNLSGGTYIEPEITVSYLTGDFAKQLTRDGAVKKFGVIKSITAKGNGYYLLKVDGKEFVNDTGQPNGYYIADLNMEYDITISPTVRSVFLPKIAPDLTTFFLTSVDFVTALKDDQRGMNQGYLDSQFFYFYIMYDACELIIQQYIP